MDRIHAELRRNRQENRHSHDENADPVQKHAEDEDGNAYKREKGDRPDRQRRNALRQHVRYRLIGQHPAQQRGKTDQHDDRGR